MEAFAPTIKTPSIATAFIRKLYRMLDIEDATVIGWDASGHSFSIRDEEQLDERVLPRYFRGRVDVFCQHLSEHGFRQTIRAGEQNQIRTFEHKHFVRGEPSRLSLIVRTPSSKRRRSRMGKKHTHPDADGEVKRDSRSTVTPSFVEEDGFDLNNFLQEPSTLAVPTVEGELAARRDETLHDSLIRILALHATNPVVASAEMIDENDGRPATSNLFQVDTPLFSVEMMTSMVEWLDTSA